jgi:hypothetical protein
MKMDEKSNRKEPSNKNRKAVAVPGDADRIRDLQEQIADLKKRWPAHSTPASMLQRLDELEEELENELKRAKKEPIPQALP